MGLWAWIKLGIGAVVILGLVGGYYELQRRGKVIRAQKEHIQGLKDAKEYYEAQPKVDKHTKEVEREIEKAVDRGDSAAVKWLYEQLRMHKRPGEGQTPTSP